MVTRYFQRVDNTEQPVALFRLVVEPLAQTIEETQWETNVGWVGTDRLVAYLIDGSPIVDEVNERTAMRSFPDAFVSRVAKVTIAKHLAGKHDQKTHASGGGRASTLNPDNHLSAPFTARVTDDGFEVDEEGMVAFLEQQRSAYENVTKPEGESVIAYQSAIYYEEINGGLREQSIMGETDLLTDENRKIIDDVDRAIDKSGFNEDIVVFRGVQDEDGMIKDMKDGDYFSDPAFQSTTLNPIVASSFAFGYEVGTEGRGASPVILRIKVPAKSPALAADIASNRALGQKVQTNSDDASLMGFSIGAEVILPRSTMYEVNATQVVDGVTLLDVTVVRND